MQKMTEEEINKIWEKIDELRKENKIEEETEYGKIETKEYSIYRNMIVNEFLYVVERVARGMHKKLKEVEMEDLISWGFDGLRHAIKRYDRSREVKFETFSIPRIKGSILDNIRNADWIPRLVRQRASQLDKAKQKLESEAGKPLSHGEIAEKMKISAEEYEEILKKATPVGKISIYATSDDDDGGHPSVYEIKDNVKSPIENILREEFFKKILSNHFTKLEKKIIHMHYIDDYTMKEIAKETGFSESRISQMHGDIIKRLASKIERNPKYMEDIDQVISN